MEDNQGLNQNPIAATEAAVIPQTEVNAVIKREKQMAFDAGRQEAEKEYLRKLEAIKQQGVQQVQHNENVSRDVDANTIYQQVQERFNQEMQQRALQKEMENIANAYTSKMNQGRTLYNDFEEVTKEFDATAFPQLVYLVSGIDNAADIIYDLSQNPSKLVTLDNLAKASPRMAQAELLKLSRSIADNTAAKNQEGNQSVREPLDHLRPSRVSGSNGEPSISDLRNQPWLRG